METFCKRAVFTEFRVNRKTRKLGEILIFYAVVDNCFRWFHFIGYDFSKNFKSKHFRFFYGNDHKIFLYQLGVSSLNGNIATICKVRMLKMNKIKTFPPPRTRLRHGHVRSPLYANVKQSRTIWFKNLTTCYCFA